MTNKSTCKGNNTITIAKLPETDDPPSPKVLTKLQSFSGEFNWLATRTRPDLSYFTSVLASACTKHSEWSLEFAQKILRYLKQTKGQGILLTCEGDLSELIAWTDAGFAGTDTKSQSGLIVSWGGSIIVWRSTRQSVSALNTAEAELNAASLGWQIVAGLRMLMSDFGVEIPTVSVMIDNTAALSIINCGGNWRTRYFAVRGHRLHEEHAKGAAQLLHCPTAIMLADSLTKLPAANVLARLHDAMQGNMPPHSTSVTPSKKLKSCDIGDGPSTSRSSTSSSPVSRVSSTLSSSTSSYVRVPVPRRIRAHPVSTIIRTLVGCSVLLPTVCDTTLSSNVYVSSNFDHNNFDNVVSTSICSRMPSVTHFSVREPSLSVLPPRNLSRHTIIRPLWLVFKAFLPCILGVHIMFVQQAIRFLPGRQAPILRLTRLNARRVRDDGNHVNKFRRLLQLQNPGSYKPLEPSRNRITTLGPHVWALSPIMAGGTRLWQLLRG